ncbi:casein kinase substrate phosphoprotein PP28-domain-containing protein [Thelonectria olida]|uniref:Casein kinase substrate phosphoprotein PP28-domain-containing protein n=1 Tax=Thelonectria olida TaxID=1576542 RepID=A0A9P8W8E9_9HYPO|nr:casein kinase substrate phosphoprotein PP28-domain-containing protein [Thelonectria olida]
MAGGTGTSSRGRGGKFKKYTRGGGKHFSRDIRPVDADGNEISMWSTDAKKKDDDDDDSDEDTESTEDSEEDSEEEDDSDEDGPSQAAPQPAVASREDRKAEKKARKEAAIAKQHGKAVEVGDLPSSDEDSDEDDDDMPANPNHSTAARNQAKHTGVDDITEGVADLSAAPSRREREALEAAAAKEKYMRLQAQGKTDEAKADLARLKVIREQRAAEAARRQAEREEKEEIEKKKKADFEAKEARKKEVKKGRKK